MFCLSFNHSGINIILTMYELVCAFSPRLHAILVSNEIMHRQVRFVRRHGRWRNRKITRLLQRHKPHSRFNGICARHGRVCLGGSINVLYSPPRLPVTLLLVSIFKTMYTTVTV